MSHTINDFLSLLFDPDEQTCFSSTPNGTTVSYEPKFGDTFFCINPLDPLKDNNPTEPYHDSLKPRRADANVLKLRNILIELDNIPLEQQIEYVTSKIPVSTIVFSGGKSYHFIISLESPIPSNIEYKNIFRRIHELLPAIDKSCKNPSRLSRLPFTMRKDTGNEQTLVKLGNRIPIEHLLPCLPVLPEIRHSKNYESKTFDPQIIVSAFRDPDSAIRDYNLSGRNQFFFWLYNRMKEFNYPTEQMYDMVNTAYDNLKNKKDFSRQEALMAARLR